MTITNSDLKDAYEGFARAVERLDQEHDLILKLREDRRETLVGKLRTVLGLPPLGQSTQ